MSSHGHVLVTGGAGFIGSNLTLALEQRGHEVVVLDDLSSGFEGNLARTRVDLVRGDILDDAALDSVVAGARAVVHLAAVPSVPRSIVDPRRSHDVNATGTVAVLEASRRHGVGHVVLASSSSIYGANPELPKHEGLRPDPVSPYAVSKLATEAYAVAWSRCYGLPVLPLRFFNVYGPHQAADHAYAAVVPSFVSAALRGEPVEVHGDGLQSRDFTYVGTVSSVISTAVERGIASDQPVNLAYGTRTTLLELLDLLEQQIGRPVERRHVEPRAGDVRDSQASQEQLSALVPDVEPVPLREGLAATVAWMADSLAGSGAR